MRRSRQTEKNCDLNVQSLLLAMIACMTDNMFTAFSCETQMLFNYFRAAEQLDSLHC